MRAGVQMINDPGTTTADGREICLDLEGDQAKLQNLSLSSVFINPAAWKNLIVLHYDGWAAETGHSSDLGLTELNGGSYVFTA